MMTPDSKNRPPTAQDGDTESVDPWLKKAREAYYASTSYMDTNYRKNWEDAIKAFNSQHPSDSKYNSPAFAKRSNIFRPKTRSVIRKNEAAAAAAFFSNLDVLDLKPEDESNKTQLASADVMKAIIQYRLKKTIPWFHIVLGGCQDAQTVGASVAHIYWDFKGKKTKQPVTVRKTVQPEDPEHPQQPTLPEGAFTMDEKPAPVEIEVTIEQEIITPLVDKPCVDLIPVENIRIDPSANWIDPVNSSPYFIHLVPMYVMDVKAKITAGEWKPVTGTQIRSAMRSTVDSTRSAREKGREDPQTTDSRGYDDIDIVWVQRHIHRDGDKGDFDFWTLGEFAMLTDPVPLKETVFHGRRPYVIGNFVLEAHRLFPSGIPQLNLGLQTETNEIANQRIDNVKFALNKKWFAKRGKNVDVTGLVRNVPGGVVMMDDPTNDVREIQWQDVTGSAFEEQNRINLDMDELMGNFNPAALIANGGGDAPARNMALLNTATGSLVEYGIRFYVVSFVEQILRQLILLEQHYETDTVVMALAGKKAQLFQKFGVDQVTDDLLNQELTLTVNVGMGATDPTQKLNKFLTGMSAYANIIKMQVPGINMVEIGKEIFGHLGYQDPTRFFTVDDLNVANLQNMIQNLQAQNAKLTMAVKEKTSGHQARLLGIMSSNASRERIAAHQEENENLRSLATHITAVMSADSKSKLNGKEKVSAAKSS